MCVEAGSAGARPVFLLPPAGDGHQNHAAPPRLLTYTPADLVAVHAWQADVEQRHLRAVRVGRGVGGRAVVNGRHRVPVQLEEQGQRRGGVAIVVDDQDASPGDGVGGRNRCRRGLPLEGDRQSDQ